MSKRSSIPAAAAGKRVVLTVQGAGNVIDVTDKDGNPVQSVVEPGTVLQKKIYNTKANSGLALANERNKQTLRDALEAEKAGDTDKAHELFNEYLNATQISFGVLLPSGIVDRLGNNVDISAKVQRIDTDNGSLLTIDPSTISIVEPEVYGTTSFNVEDILGEKPAETAKAETAKA